MIRSSRLPLNAEKIFHDVTTDEDFEGNKRNYRDLRHAFTETAFALVAMGTSESGARPKNADQLSVAAALPGYITATFVTEVSETRGAVSREQFSDAVQSRVVFNHELRTLIDHDPSATSTEVIDFLMKIYEELSPRTSPQDMRFIQKELKSTLVGMIHEIIAEQLAGKLGYEVDSEVSADEDRHGIDCYITLDDSHGGKRYGVDIKASSDRADTARKKYPYKMILATNVPRAVIGNSLRLSPEDVAHYAPLFQEEIKREWNRLNSVV